MREAYTYIRKFWKVIVTIVIIAGVSAIAMTIAKAQTVLLTVSSAEDPSNTLVPTEWTKNHTEVWTVTTSGIENADSSKITWTSSDINVIALGDSKAASVTGNVNKISAMGAGRATVTIQYSDDAGNISAPQVFTFQVGLEMTSTFPEGFLYLDSSSYILSTNYIGDDMIWTSSDETVAKVVGGTRGTATIINGGSGGVATITGVTPDQAQSVSVDVITKVQFSDTSVLEINPNEIVDLRDYTNVRKENSMVAFSENETYVKSNGQDKIIGQNAGVTYVYVYPSFDYSVSNTYKDATPQELAAAFGDVKQIRTKFSIIGGDKIGTVGDSIQLSVNVSEQDAKGVQWSSSNNKIATVDTNGKVTLLAADDGDNHNWTYITATLDSTEIFAGERLHTSAIKVTVINSFALSEASHTMNAGDSFDLTAMVTDTLAEVTWDIMDGDDVVEIAQTDDPYKVTVTGLKKGTATIRATQEVNGVSKYAYCEINVKEPVQDVSLEESSKTIDKGTTGKLYFSFVPSRPDNMKVKWVSSDEKVVKVQYTDGHSYVKLIGVDGGDAVVYVITTDGIKIAQCDVHVRIPVEGVTLSKSEVEVSMTVGKYQLSSTVLPAGGGVDRGVTWSSTDEKILTVDQNGMVTFVSPGKAVVACQTNDTMNDGKTNAVAYCRFYIKVPVDSLTLNADDVTMRVGSYKKLIVNVLPDNADDKSVTWTSTNPLIATVDETGKVTAIKSGTTAIICTSNDSGKTASCNVTVRQPVTSISLNKSKIKVKKNTTFYLKEKVGPSDAYNKSVTWKSSNTKVATVSSDGRVKAVSVGKCNIIVTSNDSGKQAVCAVEVVKSVTGVSLNYTKKTLKVGEKLKLVAKVKPSTATDRKVSFISTNPKVAKVTSKGIVTAVAGGSCYIVVTTNDGGYEAVCKITVNEKVKSIKLTGKAKYINLGQSIVLKATVKRTTATNKKIKWTSSNKKVLKVTSKGTVKAVGLGKAVIKASATDGSKVSSSTTIRVIRPVTKINVSPSTVVLIEGQERQIKASIKPKNASIQELKWTSSNPSVATVDYNGGVTAVTAGMCYIYATSTDGNNIKGIVKVTVKTAVPATAVKINEKVVNLLPGQAKSLTYKVTPANSTDTVQWISADTSVASVSKKGLLVAKGQGNTVVYAITSSGIEIECEVNVLALNSSSITVEQYDDYQLEVYGATDKVTWYTNNRRIATVNTSGSVVGRRTGTTTITAKANGKLLYCRVRVKKIKKD